MPQNRLGSDGVCTGMPNVAAVECVTIESWNRAVSPPGNLTPVCGISRVAYGPVCHVVFSCGLARRIWSRQTKDNVRRCAVEDVQECTLSRRQSTEPQGGNGLSVVIGWCCHRWVTPSVVRCGDVCSIARTIYVSCTSTLRSDIGRDKRKTARLFSLCTKPAHPSGLTQGRRPGSCV